MDGSRLTGQHNWDENWHGVKLPAKLNLEQYEDMSFELLFKRFLGSQNGKLLEVGCAPGRFMSHFAEYYGFNVDGIDYSSTGCESTKENLRLQNLKGGVYEADFLNNQLPEQSWDVVFSAGFIEHFTNPIIVLVEMRRVLASGGILLTTIPNFSGFTGTMRRIFDPVIYKQHNPMDLEELKKMYKELGFEDIDGNYFGSWRVSIKKPAKVWSIKGAVWVICKIIDKILLFFYKRFHRGIEGGYFSSHIYIYGRKP